MSTQHVQRPWAHGIAMSTDDSDLFTGRVRALRAVADWLARPAADPNALVVTGASGSGKSSLLARVWRGHVFDVAVNAHGHTAADVLQDLGAVLGRTGTRPADLVAAARRRPLVAIVDGVEEAADPHELVETLLSPLAELGGAGGIRLVLGVRSPVPVRLAGSSLVVDLDSAQYRDPAAVIEYVARYLRLHGAAPPDVIAEVSAAAGASFLTARIIARHLVDRGRIGDPVAQVDLPTSAIEAVGWDLRGRLSPMDLARAEDLLAPLAFAQGEGLPWEDVWAPAAATASGRHYDDADLAWLRRQLGGYILEVADTGRLRYRLYHQVVADHLRQTRDPVTIHAAIAAALLRRLPRGVGAHRDWADADSYALRHLSTHAASGGTLDPLLGDPGFLLRAARPALTAALDAARGAQARAAADAYRTTADELTQPPGPEQVSWLELAAHRAGATALAAEIGRSRIPRPWATQWAAWSRAPRPRTLAGGHDGAVLAVATVPGQHGLLAVTGGADGTLRLWDVAAGRPASAPTFDSVRRHPGGHGGDLARSGDRRQRRRRRGIPVESRDRRDGHAVLAGPLDHRARPGRAG